MLHGFILAVHVLLAVMIVGLVLLQRGKGAEAGAGFGAGASGTVFGARGTSTLFSKLTAVFAALFFITSLTLAYFGPKATNQPTSILERAAKFQGAAAPLPVTAPLSGVPLPGAPASSAPASSAPAAPATRP
ncbi:MAG TPA: preprotein translocase subunit SecG [Steroidobacteraceae bacterium]|nr:preprotein translocase subunit SecG [Steroidobacteraceae bacterium]